MTIFDTPLFKFFFNNFLYIVINIYICIFMDVPQSRAETKKEGYSIQVVYTVCMFIFGADAPCLPFTQSVKNTYK